jgi:hypothetical protein
MNILEEQSSMKANTFKSLTWIALLLKWPRSANIASAPVNTKKLEQL